MSGDEATLQVLEATEAQVADEVSQELEQLADRQIEQQAELDVKQAEEMLALEEDLKAEEQAGGQQVADQIEEQKLKVGITIENSEKIFIVAVARGRILLSVSLYLLLDVKTYEPPNVWSYVQFCQLPGPSNDSHDVRSLVLPSIDIRY